LGRIARSDEVAGTLLRLEQTYFRIGELQNARPQIVLVDGIHGGLAGFSTAHSSLFPPMMQLCHTAGANVHVCLTDMKRMRKRGCEVDTLQQVLVDINIQRGTDIACSSVVTAALCHKKRTLLFSNDTDFVFAEAGWRSVVHAVGGYGWERMTTLPASVCPRR